MMTERVLELVFLIVVVAGLLWLLFKAVKRLPLAGLMLGMAALGLCAAYLQQRKIWTAKQPSMDEVRAELSWFQQDPQGHALDATWRSLQVMKRDGWVAAVQKPLLPGDLIWVYAYTTCFVKRQTVFGRYARLDTLRPPNPIGYEFSSVDTMVVYVRTLQQRPTDYVVKEQWSENNVFVKVWRKPRLTATQELLVVMAAGLGVFLIGCSIWGFRRKREEPEIVRAEPLSLSESRRLYDEPNESESGESMIDIPGSADIDAYFRSVLRYRGNPKGLADYLTRLWEDKGNGAYIRQVQRATQEAGVVDEYLKAMVVLQQSKTEVYKAFLYPEIDRDIVKIEKETQKTEAEAKRADAEATLEQSLLRRDQARKSREELWQEKGPAATDPQMERIQECEIELAKHEGMLTSKQIERFRDLIRSNPRLTLEKLREVLRQAKGKKTKIEDLVEAQEFDLWQRAGAADRGATRQMEQQKEDWEKWFKGEERKIRRQEQRGEISAEEAERKIAGKRQVADRKIAELEK